MRILRRFAGRAGYALALRVAWALISFAGAALLARWFSTKDYGNYAAVISLVSFLAVVCALGTPNALIRLLAEYGESKQAGLARGVLNADLDWNLILMGAGVGVAVICIDEILGFLKVLRIPPLAVGIGMYLPQDVTTPVVAGAIIGWFYNRTVEKRENGEMAKRFGVLLACGFIVGESYLWVAGQSRPKKA